MITASRRGGWGQARRIIHYISIWDAVFRTQAPLKFLSGNLPDVVDAEFGGSSDITITVYPHNREDIIATATLQEEKIRALLIAAYKENPKATAFSVILDKEAPRILSSTDFGYSPPSSPETTMFIFEDEKEGLPNVYVVEKSSQMNHTEIMRLFSDSAAFIIGCANAPTDIGKELTYIMLSSRIHGEFTVEHPVLGQMDFPTRKELPKNLNMEDLLKFSEVCGADKLTTKIDKKQEKEENPFGEPDDVLRDMLLQDSRDKAAVSLARVFQYGPTKTLSLLPISDKPITVIPDIPGLFKKACIFQGIFHIIPIENDFDAVSFFNDGDDSMYAVDSEDSFPKRFFPAPEKVI